MLLNFEDQRSRIQGGNIIKMTLIVLTVLGAAHIVLGSNPLVPALAVITMVLAMWPIARYGVMNIAAILLMLVAFRYVGFPLVAKLTVGQALDTHLDQPVTAYAAVLLGIISYLTAVFLASKINIGKPILKPLVEPRMLRRLSFAAFAVGVVANLDVAMRVAIKSDALTISSFFTPFLHLALIAAASSALLRSEKHSPFDLWVLFIFALEVLFAFVRNARSPILEAILCLALVAAVFHGRFSKKQIVGGFAVFLLLMSLTPMMLYVRSMRDDLTMVQRIGATMDALANWEVVQSAFINSMERESLSSGYFLRYYDTPNNVYDRLSYVNMVDVLITGADNTRTLGFEVVDQSVERALPRFLAPNKPRDFSEGDWIYCEFGVKCLYGNFLTATLIGVGYAAFGWVGILLFPFTLGLSLLLLIKKAVGFNMVGNVWAVYLLVVFNNQFVEGGAASYIGMLFRFLPQNLAVMLVLASLVGASRIVFRKSG